MVVVYLYGKSVFSGVSIQYVLTSFTDLDKAVRLISEKIGLEFEKSIDSIGYKVYDCLDYSRDVKIIAESKELLK